MSRRKQAKPRLWKREEEDDEGFIEHNIQINQIPLDGNEITQSDDDDELLLPVQSFCKVENSADEDSDEDIQFSISNIENQANSPEYLHDLPKDDQQFDNFVPDPDDDTNSIDSDTLGTEGGSSWGSEDHTTSPSSSCATPNSTTEVPDSDLSYTIGVTDGTPHACRFCEKAFPRHSYLKKHEQTHADCMPFRCEYCRRLFKHKRSRDRHIKLHTGDKKYRCAQCEAAFSRSDHLKIHMKTHDNQKPFQCQVCNRGYNTAAALTSHMQNHNKKLVDSPSSPAAPGTTFKCLQCSEVFRKPEELQNHTNTHQLSEMSQNVNNRASKYPVIRLTCTYCTKDNFTTMEALQSHVQSAHKSILNGDLHRELSIPKTPFSNYPLSATLPYGSYYCDLCTMRFSSSQSLQKHITVVHYGVYNNLKMPELINNGKLYCVYCAMHFLTPASFAEHYIVFHSPYHPQLLGMAHPEQMKPTDLSTNGRKSSPVKRSASSENKSSPKRKSRTPNGNVTANRHYDYPGTLLCSQCNAAFSDFDSFRSHIKLHIEESGGLLGGATPDKREFCCPHCRASFQSAEESSQHIVAHFLATGTQYSCENCQRSFTKADDLQVHLLDTHAQRLYSCSICNEVFESKVTIQVHFAVRHSNEAKVYKCTGCPTSNAVYHSEVEFATHVKTIHADNSSLLTTFTTHHNAQVMRCFICHMNFPSELDLQLHLATHGKQFQCTACPQSFHIEYLLDKHMQTQHNLQQMNGTRENGTENSKNTTPSLSPNGRNDAAKKSDSSEVACDMCEKRDFQNENDLLTHKKLFHRKSRTPDKHSNESQDSVDERLKVMQNQSPSNHRYDPGKIQESFNNTNDNNCDICEKCDFTNESELSSHKKLVHHVKLTSPGKVSLHCAYCNEICKSRSDLENHMKSHSQNSSSTGKHKCIICDEMCPTAAGLAEHKLTHCKVLSAKTCMQCKGSITTEEQYYSHIQQHSNPSGTNSNNNLILPTVCVICRQTLVSEMEARMHARFHLHQSADLVPCSVCFQTNERQDLIAGICKECYQRHGKSTPFRCPECHLKFDNGAAIEIHLATVHRKNYQCIKCQVSFDSEKDIQHHVASHLITSQHECRLCRLALPSAAQLQIHLIEHTFAGCATFTCYLCSSVFTTAQGLQTHILEHGLQARPYDCPRCKQKFFFTSELEHHSYVHLEEYSMKEGHYYYGRDKPHTEVKYSHPAEHAKFNCSECRLDFVHEADLRKHVEQYHAEYDNTYEDVKKEDKIDDDAKAEVKIKVERGDESEDEQIDVVTTKADEITSQKIYAT